MPGSSVDPTVIDIINQSQSATMAPQVVLTSGAGKAYQSVAQSSAIAVQDATDALRNISTIATTAAGVAMAQLLATGDAKYATALTHAQDLVTSATTDYANIGAAAAKILSDFPSG
ncbi:MAG: hypothetical protein WDN44_03255 [Sphingomonas sp.]